MALQMEFSFFRNPPGLKIKRSFVLILFHQLVCVYYTTNGERQSESEKRGQSKDDFPKDSFSTIQRIVTIFYDNTCKMEDRKFFSP